MTIFYPFNLPLSLPRSLSPVYPPTMTAAYAACLLTRQCNTAAYSLCGRSMTTSDMIVQIHPCFERTFVWLLWKCGRHTNILEFSEDFFVIIMIDTSIHLSFQMIFFVILVIDTLAFLWLFVWLLWRLTGTHNQPILAFISSGMYILTHKEQSPRWIVLWYLLAFCWKRKTFPTILDLVRFYYLSTMYLR